MNALRLTCIVPGCRHTRGQHKGERPIQPGEQWVCRDHWRLVPRQMRAIVAGARRRCRRRPSTHAEAAFRRLWDRCAREAIERGLGLK